MWEKDPGDWTGGAEMTMVLGFPIAIGILIALMVFWDLSVWQNMAIVMVASAVLLPLFYRHVKGFWLAIVRLWEGPNPQPSPIREPEWFVAFWDREGR